MPIKKIKNYSQYNMSVKEVLLAYIHAILLFCIIALLWRWVIAVPTCLKASRESRHQSLFLSGCWIASDILAVVIFFVLSNSFSGNFFSITKDPFLYIKLTDYCIWFSFLTGSIFFRTLNQTNCIIEFFLLFSHLFIFMTFLWDYFENDVCNSLL